MFACIGVSGNLFVVVVIFSMTRMRKKVTNMFIISQSCTDLFVAIMLMGEYQPQPGLYKTCLWQSCSCVSISLSQSCTDLFVAIMLMGEYQLQSELHRPVCGNHAHG